MLFVGTMIMNHQVSRLVTGTIRSHEKCWSMRWSVMLTAPWGPLMAKNFPYWQSTPPKCWLLSPVKMSKRLTMVCLSIPPLTGHLN